MEGQRVYKSTEAHRAESLARYYANREKVSAQKKAVYALNREKIIAKVRSYKQANPDKVKECSLASYRKHREKRLANCKIYQQANKEKRRVYMRRWNGLPEPTRPESALCECCQKPPRRGSLHLDHCHETGKFRGWLCSRCNMAIGKLGDTKAALIRAVKYLELSEKD